MTHQIPPHLAFCTPGKNQKVEQGTNLETLNISKHPKEIELYTKKHEDRNTVFDYISQSRNLYMRVEEL